MDKLNLELLSEVPFQVKSDKDGKTTIIVNSRLCAGMLRTWRRYHLDLYQQFPSIELFDKDDMSMGLVEKFHQGKYGQKLMTGGQQVDWDSVVSIQIDTSLLQQFIKFMNMFYPVYRQHNTPNMLRVVTVRGTASAFLLTRGNRNIGRFSRSFYCKTENGVEFSTTFPRKGTGLEMLCFMTPYDECWEAARHKAIYKIDQLHHGFAA